MQKKPNKEVDTVQNKQHELNMKQMDVNRREHRAEFHIRQRDNIIAELRE